MKSLIEFMVKNSHFFTLLSDNVRELRLREKAVEKIEKNERKVFFLNFLRFIGAENKESLLKGAELFNNEKISFVSVCCFHTEKDRESLVKEISSEILELIGVTIRLALNGQKNIRWDILTFGPDDWDFLADSGCERIVLPYMLKADSRVEFKKQFELTSALVDKLKDEGIPANLLPLNSLFSNGDFGEILEEAERRAEKIFKKLSKNPPEIFQILKTDEERIDRCRREAIAYLILTNKYADNSIYLGLEVHGGYWRAGNLNKLNGKTLPIFWLHPALCQHWGEWAEREKAEKLFYYKQFLESASEIIADC